MVVVVVELVEVVVAVLVLVVEALVLVVVAAVVVVAAIVLVVDVVVLVVDAVVLVVAVVDVVVLVVEVVVVVVEVVVWVVDVVVLVVVVVDALVVLAIVVVDVVAGGGRHVPSSGGHLTLNSVAPLFVIVPVENATLYESPSPSSSSMHPSVPGSGGTIDKGACFALALTLIRKSWLLVFLICAKLTGPCSPFGSL